MLLVAILIGFATVILGLLLWMKKNYGIWKDMGAPYEEPSLFFGNLKGFDKDANKGEILDKFYVKYKEKAPFVGIFFFVQPVALITDLELVKNILVKDFNFFHDRGLYCNEKDEPIAANLMTLTGHKWKSIRSKITPSFTSGKMKAMFPIMYEIGRRLELKLEDLIEQGEDIDIKALMARFTIDAIGSCAFGMDCNSLENDKNSFFQVGVDIFEKPRQGTRDCFLLIAFRKLALKLGVRYFYEETVNFYTQIVRKTVDYRIKNDVHRNDFIELLIKLYQSQNEDRLTFNELLAQSYVFLVAGFETSATTLQFCLYCLASNPDIQEAARVHVNEVIAKHNGEITYEALTDMKYLDQVVNEALRLYPPAPNVIRIVTNDYKVPNTKFVLKKGTIVIIPVFSIQRDPKYFPNPLEYNPDNFSEENVQNRPQYTHLPFGDGPRICIASRFAYMQIKTGLVATLRKCKISVSPRTKQPLQLRSKFLVTNVDEGVWLKLEALS